MPEKSNTDWRKSDIFPNQADPTNVAYTIKPLASNGDKGHMDKRKPLLVARVVGSLLRDSDIMRVTLVHATGRDAHELGIVESLNVLRATVAHARTYATEQLIDDLIERALIWHTR